ncbi:MAG: helix-turn-helix domain-containing protein [Eubacteriales bacterium]|nr:helix-turn-helix domain-containing protein [Eubacteriales bacterium]
MPIHQVIVEKRKALGLTQEQVAELLGVSAPAVSKWETGASCPDLGLLAPLARLLKTDLNTLLCFREDLTREEIQALCRELTLLHRAQGPEAAMGRLEEVLRAYPASEELMLTLVMHLDGVLTMSGETGFDERLEGWYRRLEQSGEPVIRNTAQTMLVSRLIRREAYDQAQAVLDRIPDRQPPTVMDKLFYQTTIDQCTGRGEKAAADLEQALLEGVNRVMLLLSKLVSAELSLGDISAARAAAEKAGAIGAAMELWEITQAQVLLPVALKEENAEQALAVLRTILRAARHPWHPENTTLFRRVPTRNVRLDGAFLKSVCDALEQDPDCAFLREDRRFGELLAEFREENVGEGHCK